MVNRHQPINPPPAVGARDGELPAYLSNGMIGLRLCEVPILGGVAIVNGVVGRHPERRIEAVAHVPYPLAADLGVGQAWLSEQAWSIERIEQEYDFASGEITSRFTCRLGGVGLTVESVCFASRTHATIVGQQVTITADRQCELDLCFAVSADGVRGHVERHHTDTPGEPEPICDGSLCWVTDGELSQCGIAFATQSADPCPERRRRDDLTGAANTRHRLKLAADQPATATQLVAMVPSIVHLRPDEEAVRRIVEAKRLGFDELRVRNRACWAEIWRSRIVLEGASREHQALIDAAFYYLNCSVHAASPAATSIFGLASWPDYHYYYGHVMWDVDTFCLPTLCFFQPEAARALLEFRRRGVEAARSIAQLSGLPGLQYPWEAAPRNGQEATPGGGSGATHAHHVSLHVARGFSLFADIVRDPLFTRQAVWPILSGVAQWAVARLTETDRGFELRAATGPAEVPVPPDNDTFTLMAIRDVLLRAIRLGQSSGDVPSGWQRVVDRLYLPVRSDGAIASSDDFRIDQEKGATPSPLAGFFPLDFPADERRRDATLALFLDQWRDYVGSPMLPALYPVWAAMAGDRRLALKLFEEGYAAYDAGRFHQCLEYRADHADSKVRAGPFFANLGGMLLALTIGLPGLVIDDGDPADWPRRKVVLPSGWTAIRIDRLWVGGRAMRLVARHGQMAELTPA